MLSGLIIGTRITWYYLQKLYFAAHGIGRLICHAYALELTQCCHEHIHATSYLYKDNHGIADMYAMASLQA